MSGTDFYNLTQIVEKYFTLDDLRILLKTKLNRDMASITQAQNYRTQVFEVVSASEREGWVEPLIEAIRGERPHIGEVVSGVKEVADNESKKIDTIIALLTGGYGQKGFIQNTEDRLTAIEEQLKGRSTTNVFNSPTIVSLVYMLIGMGASMAGYVVWVKFLGF